jgi:NAD kinase
MRFWLTENPTSKAVANAIRQQLLQSCGDSVLDPATVIPVGGDGTFIHALHYFGTAPLYLPLNCGSVGYLLNDFDAATCQKLKTGDYHVQAMPVLQTEKEFAFNEVAFQSVGGQAAHIEIEIDGHAVTKEPLVGSGVIIYTPQGSTGWAYSAGATCSSAIAPPSIGVVAINPYSPRVPSFVVPATSRVVVRVLDLDHRPVVKYVDGMPRQPQPVNEITCALDPAKVIYLNSHDFTGRLMDKIIR